MENLKIIIIGLIGIAGFVFFVLIPEPWEAITFCNSIDCYEVKDEAIQAKSDECFYQAKLNMLVLHWKQINKWEQIEYVGAGNQKIIHCIPEIPQTFLDGNETDKQLAFLDGLRCKVHNMRHDPVLYQIYYFDECIHTFEPEKHLR